MPYLYPSPRDLQLSFCEDFVFQIKSLVSAYNVFESVEKTMLLLTFSVL